jgi:hypothetical protein
MNAAAHDLSLKLVYVAILAGRVLAFTSPMHVTATQNSRPAAHSTLTR